MLFSFTGNNGYDSSVDMGCVLVHVQDCRYDIIRAVGFTKPVEIILAPLVEFPGSFYALHIFGCAGEHNPQCTDLVRTNLAGQSGGIEAMLDSLCPIFNSFREFD